MLPPGTRMSDVDATVQDSPEEIGCGLCGEDPGNCCCWEEESNETPNDEEMGMVQEQTAKAAQPAGTEREISGHPRRGNRSPEAA